MRELLFGRRTTRWGSVKPAANTGLKQVWIGGVKWAEEHVTVSRELGVDPSDNFNRANETPLAAPWTRLTGGSGNINLVSNAITASAAGDKYYYYAGAAATADQFSQLKQNSAVTASDWGPAVRIGSNGFSGYFFTPYTGGGGWTVGRHSAGTHSIIEDLADGAFADGDTAGIEISGSTITSLKNGAAVTGSPSTDTGLTTLGNGPGVFLYETGGSLDDWQGGDLGAGGNQQMSGNYFQHRRRSYRPAPFRPGLQTSKRRIQ